MSETPFYLQENAKLWCLEYMTAKNTPHHTYQLPTVYRKYYVTRLPPLYVAGECGCVVAGVQEVEGLEEGAGSEWAPRVPHQLVQAAQTPQQDGGLHTWTWQGLLCNRQ